MQQIPDLLTRLVDIASDLFGPDPIQPPNPRLQRQVLLLVVGIGRAEEQLVQTDGRVLLRETQDRIALRIRQN